MQSHSIGRRDDEIKKNFTQVIILEIEFTIAIDGQITSALPNQNTIKVLIFD